MNPASILWSVLAGSALALALVQLTASPRGRSALASLTLFLATGFAGIALVRSGPTMTAYLAAAPFLCAIVVLAGRLGGKLRRAAGIAEDSGRTQQRFHQIVEASPDGILLADGKGAVLRANRHAADLLGCQPDELTWQPLDALLPGLSTSRAGEACELTLRRQDGRPFPVEIAVHPLEGGAGALVFITDLSARRHLEEEARRHRDELAHVTRVTTLSELSGSLAHELNQPLAIILANAQAAQRLLERRPPDLGEVKAILSDIIDEDRRAGEVIQRLRTLLKRGETKMEAISLNEIASEVLQLTRADLIDRSIAVSRGLAAGLPAVAGDRIQLQQILLNLILNGADAMAATPPGNRSLHVATSFTEDRVRLSVFDTGTGLPEQIERLFEPFFTTKPHGLGMGLAICRTLATAHCGHLFAERQPGDGAAFHLELPAADARA